MASAQISASSKYSVKRFVMIAAKLAVTGGLVWYLVREVDLDESGEHLAGFDAGLGIVALLVVALLFLIAALRWHIYAQALNISLNVGTAFRLYLIGQFFGQILPAGVGGDIIEALRARANADGVFEIARSAIKPGDQVRVQGGPMADLEGIFEAELDSDRVLILLKLMGREVRVSVAGGDVEPI